MTLLNMEQVRDWIGCDRPLFVWAFPRWVACGMCERCDANPDLDPEAS